MTWQSKTLARVSGGTLVNNSDWQINALSIDTRLIEEGNMFVACKGEVTDGHLYLANAFQKGAVAAMVEHIPDNTPTHYPLLVVPNSLQAINNLAAYNRQSSKAIITAVTGSAGKTSTKEILKIAFNSQGKTFANYGNYNNLLGVPISLSNLPLDSEFAIFELGMNHIGEILALSELIKPFISIITTVNAAHLEFFCSVEQIAEAKAEIFMHTDPNGFAIINYDNNLFPLLYNKAKESSINNIISFGEHPKADCRMLEYIETQKGSRIKADILGQVITYELGSYGMHLAQNSLAVLGAISASGKDLKTAANNLINFHALAGRGASHYVTKHGKQFLIIDDSYNANPISMKAALKVLGSCKKLKGRKIAILSDMYELGPTFAELHQELAKNVVDNNIDKVIIVGEHMKFLYNALPEDKKLASFNNTSEVIKVIYDYIENDDMVLIKGSFGTSIFKLVKELLS